VVRAMNDDRSDDVCLLAAHRRGSAGGQAHPPHDQTDPTDARSSA
jgi:hypothetical protein